MTNMTKKELISVTKKRYLKADKKDKGKILVNKSRYILDCEAGQYV